MKTIDQLWEESKLTLDDLSLRSGLSRERVEAIIDGRWTPSPEERSCLATVLGVAVADISWGHSLSPRLLRYRQHGFREEF